MERVYIVDNPSHPKEQSGAVESRNGVVRTVTYVNGAKVVAWDYTNDKWGSV